MALLVKGDLQFSYSWTVVKGDDPKVSGEPDSTLFNRNEGYEVLYLINKLAEKWGLQKKVSGQKMERMIKEHLPSDTRSQNNVAKWLKDHWDKH